MPDYNSTDFEGTFWSILDGDYYVSTIGNDISGKGTPQLPFLTVDRAYEEAIAGDKIVIGPDEYISYRDSPSSSIGTHTPCRVASISTFTFGAGGGGLATIDGVDLAIDDRVLLWKQTNPEENGIYIAAVGVWTRAEDFADADLLSGQIISVLEGDTFGETLFQHVTTGEITFETSPILIKKAAVTDWGEIQGTLDDQLDLKEILDAKTNRTNVLELDNVSSYTPSSDYHPTTMKFVEEKIAAIDKATPMGTLDCSSNPNYPTGEIGDYYYVSVAGKIGGASGDTVQIGDKVQCIQQSAAGTATAVGNHWVISQGKLDKAGTPEAAAGIEDNKYMTAAKSFEGWLSWMNTKIVEELETDSDKIIGAINELQSYAATSHAATASKWENSRTLTLEGNLTGSVSIDGAADAILLANYVDDGTFLRANADDIKTSGYLLMKDNLTLRLGDGSDFRMWFGGNNTIFRNYAHEGGDIIFQGENNLGVNENLMILDTSGTEGYVRLFQGNSEKMRTVSDGIEVFGSIYTPGKIIHTGNTSTYTQFSAANTWRVVTGAGVRLLVGNTGITVTGSVVLGAASISEEKITNWDAAHLWGNHASAGYLSSAGGTISGEININNTLTVTAPEDAYGIKILRNINSIDEPASLLIATDADATDDMAIEIRGNSSGPSVDTSNTLSSPDTKFVVYGNGHTVIGRSGLGANYTALNGSLLDVNGILNIAGNIHLGGDLIGGNVDNWDAAHGWGNHATAGYLTAVGNDFTALQEQVSQDLSEFTWALESSSVRSTIHCILTDESIITTTLPNLVAFDDANEIIVEGNTIWIVYKYDSNKIDISRIVRLENVRVSKEQSIITYDISDDADITNNGTSLHAVHGMTMGADYLFFTTRETPMKLGRVHKNNFADISIIEFPNDGNYKGGDISVYHKGFIYINTADFSYSDTLKIVKVSENDLSNYTLIIDDDTPTVPGPFSIYKDTLITTASKWETNVILSAWSLEGKLIRTTTIDLGAISNGQAHGGIIHNGFYYITTAFNNQILKINADDFSLVQQAAIPHDATDDMIVGKDGFIYIGTEDYNYGNGLISSAFLYKIDLTDLSIQKTLATLVSSCYAIASSHTNITNQATGEYKSIGIQPEITVKSTNYTLLESDNGNIIECTGTLAVAVPASGITSGWNVQIVNIDTGTITINGNGQDINSKGSTNPLLEEQWVGCTLYYNGTNFVAIGDLT